MKLFKDKKREHTEPEMKNMRQKVQENLLGKISKSLDGLNKNILEMNYIADGTNVAINAVGNSIDIINEGNSELASRTKEINQITIDIDRKSVV